MKFNGNSLAPLWGKLRGKPPEGRATSPRRVGPSVAARQVVAKNYLIKVCFLRLFLREELSDTC